MAEFKNAIITNQGRELASQVLAGDKMEFTRVVASDYEFTGDIDYAKITTIPEIKQKADINNVIVENEYNVSVYAQFTNTELTEGYEVRTVGVYAKNVNGEEILYSISTTDRPDYMPPFNSVTLSAIDYRFITSVSNSENVNIDISEGNKVTKQEFDILRNEVKIKSDLSYVDSRFDEVTDNLKVKSDKTYVDSELEKIKGTILTEKTEPIIGIGDQWHKEY